MALNNTVGNRKYVLSCVDEKVIRTPRSRNSSGLGDLYISSHTTQPIRAGSSEYPNKIQKGCNFVQSQN